MHDKSRPTKGITKSRDGKRKIERVTTIPNGKIKAEDVLKDRNFILQSTFDIAQDGLSILSKDLTILRTNPIMEKWNAPAMPLVGKKCYKAYHDADKPCEACPSLRCMKTGKPESNIIPGFPGTDLLFELFSYPLKREPDGEVIGVIELIHDITENKRTEKKLARLNKVLKTIANVNEDIFLIRDRQKLLKSVCQRIVEYAYRLVWIGFCDEKTKQVVPEAQAGFEEGYLDSIKITYNGTKYSKGPTGTALRTGKPCVMRFIATDPAYKPWRQEALKRGYHSSAAIPIFGEKQVIGALNVYADKEDAFDDEEIKLLEELAHDISTGLRAIDEEIKCKIAEQALRDNEMTLQTIIKVSPLPIIMLDTEGKVDSIWNPAAESVLGWKRKEVLGKQYPAIPEGKEKEFTENLKRSSRSENIKGAEVRRIKKDGTPIDYHIFTAPVHDRNGNVKNIMAILLDITEKKQAEQILKQSEARYRTIIQTAMDGFWLSDIHGHILEVNDAYCRMSGYSREELTQMSIQQLEAVETSSEVIHHIREIVTDGMDSFESVHRCKDGSLFNVEVSTHYLPIEGGRLFCFFRDITERKKAQKELQRLAGFWESIVENANVYMNVVDENRNVLMWNKAAERISGYSADEVVGHDKIWQWQYPDQQYRKKIIEAATQVLGGKELKEFESIIATKSGEKRVISWYSRNLTDENGRPIGSVATGIDITERKKAEAKILDTQKQLKSMVSQLTLAEERERRRLAERLHDGISQELVISKLKLDTLSESSGDKDLRKKLKTISTSVGKTIRNTRSLTFDLSFPVLYELGFEAAVPEWLSEQIAKQYGIETQFEDDGRNKPLDEDIRILLFRSVRELLWNVIKHSKASKVKVSTKKVSNNIEVIVEDNGVGFDTATTKRITEDSGFGLLSIRERLEELGGNFEIKSEIGKGCKVILTAPLKRKKPNEGEKNGYQNYNS
ncbi:MAG: PAS domain S-box protein [Sedimentisphaerales bacterium]|nr:PAS domain S-box protein [Sedimentisphaerales bacterium]